jgi:hypothetical protein
MIILIFFLFSQLHSWEQELTMDMVQKYQAPTTIINILKDHNIDFSNMNRTIHGDIPELFLKKDISRIVGHVKIKEFLGTKNHGGFDVPDKFLVPFFTEHGEFNTIKSYVISMRIKGEFVKYWSPEHVQLLLDLGEYTKVIDFWYQNIKQDIDKKYWFIDTQVDNQDYDTPRLRAAQSLLKNFEWHAPGYRLEDDSMKLLHQITQTRINETK